MITVKQLYDAYPDSDLLPIEVTEQTTLYDIEAEKANLGDLLFLFLCHELCNPHDQDTTEVMAARLNGALDDITAVRRKLFGSLYEGGN